MAIPSGRSFATCYAELCKQQHLRPLAVISVTLPHSLDFTTDRVKMDHWGPILNSLSLDRSLKSISVRSRYQSRKPLEEVNSEDKARAVGKAPVVLTRYLLEWLSHSVAQCVRNSPNLTCLELEGIPFPPDCLAVLCVGLAGTETLQHLSLQRCYIGDGGCELVCRTVADVQSISSLNLSQCDLTASCGPALAAALSKQKLSLYQDTWKQSLRYREPNLEAMSGLRRLTLNDNPRLGDTAVLQLIEAIRDSLWLKALDLRHCGITDRIGKDLVELLDHNTTLVVLDIRLNANLNDDIAAEVVRRLEENAAKGKSEYRWFGLPQKIQRTASAGSRTRNECDDGKKTLPRPRSAAATRATRPTPSTVSRRQAYALNAAKRTMIRPPLPSPQESEGVRQQRQVVRDLPPRPRTSIHLDLRPDQIRPDQIRPVGEKREKTAEDDRSRANSTSVNRVEGNTVTLRCESAKENQDRAILEAGIQEALKQLADARAEHERLLEETKRNDLLLAEETAKREVAEARLRTVKAELTELERALKEKERENEGYLLVSQQSLDEICTSFDRLLEMVENVARNSNGRNESIEVVKADIKRRVAFVIRKTKSENLRRGHVARYDDVHASRHAGGTTKKFAKSESDVRTSVPPLLPMHLERNIGDSPDLASPYLEGDSFIEGTRVELEKLSMTPAERARAIFARIVNGDVLLDFASHD